MSFEHINPTGPSTTGFEAKIDERCLKLTVSYNSTDRNKYCVHYMGINKVKELRDYLEEVLLVLEEQLLEEVV